MKDFALKITLYVMKSIMNFIYFFIKIFTKQKNKIVMLSRQSNKVGIDFKMLKEEIEKNYSEYQITILCKMIPKKFWGRVKYCFYIIKCMYHLATSKVCIVDGYVIPVSALKHKKGLVIVQTWHAMGAIKKFGYQTLDKNGGSKRSVANIMRMHKNYTFITCASESTKIIYSKAFEIPKEQILTLGMPRIDYILGKNNEIDNKVQKLIEEYPNLKEKKVILYVPTFRKGKYIPIQNILKIVNTEKYNLIIRLHPLDGTKVEEKYKVSSEYTAFDLLKIADYIITDYSAIAFEASILNKPTYFYLYDIMEYNENIGLNIDFQKEMKNASFQEFEPIYNAIEMQEYNMEELENFKNKYIETNDTNNSQRIIQEIMQKVEK